MSITRAAIEARIASYLNRSTDVILRPSISDWFNIAYVDAQRPRNLMAAQITAKETFALDHPRSVCAPVDLKEPYEGYSYDPVTDRLIRFYSQTDIQTLRYHRKTWHRERHLEPLWWQGRRFTGLYAIWAGSIEFWPDVTATSGLIGKEFRLDYYRWLPLPGSDIEDDWLVTYAGDYLTYRALRESAPFLVADDRVQVWKAAEQTAEARIQGVDVSAANAGPLRIRG